MNATAIGTGARALAVTIVIVLAAISGLVLGNAIQGRLSSADSAANIGGMVPQNRGGTAAAETELGNFVPGNLGGTTFTKTPDFVDYGVRHIAKAPADYADYGVRHAAAATAEHRQAKRSATQTPR